MSKSIILKNQFGVETTYENVNKVVANTSDGNKAIFVDEDILEDKAYSSGGKYLIRVIDYDGTIIKEDYLNAGEIFNLPTELPEHDKLEFVEWTSNLGAIEDSYITVIQDTTIAPIYTTKSGNSEIDIEVTKETGTSFTLYVYRSDYIIDWGDSSDTETSSSSGNSHTYEYGNYTITLEYTGSVDILGITIGRAAHGTSFVDKFVKEMRFSTRFSSIYISYTSNYYTSYYNLKYISLPKGITHFSCDCATHALETICLPSSVVSFYFDGAQRLKHLIMPASLTTIVYPASYLYSLEELALPINPTGIFYSQVRLDRIYYTYNEDTTLTRLASRDCPIVYDFSQSTIIPTLSTSSPFYYSSSFPYKIVVPDDLYDDWIVATNWSSLANYIYKVSETE